MAEIRIVSADGFPDWAVRDGAWIVFSRDPAGKLLIVLGEEEHPGLLKTRAEFVARCDQVRARNQKILGLRISPENMTR